MKHGRHSTEHGLEEIDEAIRNDIAIDLQTFDAVLLTNRNVIRVWRMLFEAKETIVATAEQVRLLGEKTARLEQAESFVEDELRQVIEDLKAHQGDQPDPELDAIGARLEALTGKVTQLGTDEAPAPPAETTPPTDTTPPADGGDTTSADTTGDSAPADDTQPIEPQA